MTSAEQPFPFVIRLRKEADLRSIIDLMKRVYPPERFGQGAIWKEENLRRHIATFPDGQLVALSPTGDMLGTSTTMRVSRQAALSPHGWMEITGQGTLSTHNPDGDVLYGVNIAVDPVFQGQSVGKALYHARIDLARRLKCSAFAAGARIPGYQAHQRTLSPEAYIKAVISGELFDPTLSKQIHLGFAVLGTIRDYAPDPETCNHAALILMELP